MSRKKKNTDETGDNSQGNEDKLPTNEYPEKTYTIDEAARHFNVDESAIRTWIDHGHLRKVQSVGITRISGESIANCRFKRVLKGNII